MTSLFKTWGADKDQQPRETESTAEPASQTEVESARSSFSLLEAQAPAPWPPREEFENEKPETSLRIDIPAEYPPAPEPDGNQVVTLQVCTRRFTTTVKTLTSGSRFFATFFYDPDGWDDEFGGYENRSVLSNLPRASKPFMQLQEDGSYFLDADPDHFVHILRYLRLGEYPIFYTKNAGHDYGAYFGVLLESRRFQIHPLFQWIRHAQYNRCVSTYRDMSMETFREGAFPLRRKMCKLNEEEEVHSKWSTEKVYVCPRGIEVHKGRPDFCGRACENSRQYGSGDSYERKPVITNMVIRRVTEFMPLDCEHLLAN